MENQNWENVGHQSWKKHEKWGRKKAAAKIEVRNVIRAPGKRARKFFSVNFDNFKRKGSPKLLVLWGSNLTLDDHWWNSQSSEQTLFPAPLILESLDLILGSGKLQILK